MPTMKLTQLAVERIGAPTAGRIEYFDTVLPSFGLRVASTGSRSWIVFYRVNGKQRRYTLGTLAKIPKVDSARDLARDVLHEVAKGNDPAEVKAEAKKAVMAPAAEPDTVRRIAAQFIERYAKPKNRTWAETQRKFELHVFPLWGDREIGTITRRDVLDLLDHLADQGYAVAPRRVFSAVHRLFAWAVERDIIPTNPAAGVKPPGKETERDRVLTDDELARLLRATDEMGPIAGGFLKMLILSGQRRDEVATMKWTDIDFDRPIYEARDDKQIEIGRGVWTLPRERTKGDRQHEVPLSPQMHALLTALPRLGDYVFTTRGDRPLSGYSKIKARADKLSEIEEPWRIHDLRRTAGTGMASLGVAPGTISRVLNHKEGGVTKIYNRFGYLPEKYRALSVWGRKVEHLTQPAEGNVVDLAEVRG